MPTNDTVAGRFSDARSTLTPTQLAIGLLLVLSMVFVMAFVQDPMVHDSLHHFRHGVGITCN